jgi:DNA gyrase subunit A
LVVSEKGYGKRSDVEDYRLTNRGGKGVKALNITEKTGNLVAIKEVTDNNDLMIITKAGILIRIAVADLRVMGRNTQGVKLIRLKNEADEISSVTKIVKDPEEEVIVDSDAVVVVEDGENEILSSEVENTEIDTTEGEEGDVPLPDESGEE